MTEEPKDANDVTWSNLDTGTPRFAILYSDPPKCEICGATLKDFNEDLDRWWCEVCLANVLPACAFIEFGKKV